MHQSSPQTFLSLRPGQAVLHKSQAVDEVLDLTNSPCPSPEHKPPRLNGAPSLNGVAAMNGRFGVRRGTGEGGIPETSYLEELISQEQQRARRPHLQHNVARNSVNQPQTIHAQKQHTVSMLQQHRANPGHLLTPQQNTVQFNSQLLRHNGSKPDISTLTSQGLGVQQFQLVNSMSRPHRPLQHPPPPPPIQQDGHQHSLMRTHAHSLHTVRENHIKMPVYEPAPLSLKLSQSSQQGSLGSQSITENPATPQDDFFNLDMLHSQYSLSSQAPPSPSFSSSSPGTSSLFSSDPQSSSLSDSISPFAASSSERLTLPLPNGHCSMDAQDAHGGSADRRHSVIQFNSLDWDAT